MKESFELKENFNTSPNVIYEAWLCSDHHTNMTGGGAKCSKQINEDFTAWNGYISGKNIELIENQRIVQAWRSSEFDENDEDSILIITLKETNEGTELTLTHTNIPTGQTQYKQGWIDHYFTPMKAYFE